jgi:hypothetical protein
VTAWWWNARTSNRTRVLEPGKEKNKKTKKKVSRTHVRLRVRVFGGLDTGNGGENTPETKKG